jgi:hypothetical protein
MDGLIEAKLFKFLLKNPDGVQRERIMNACGFETSGSFTSAMGRVRLKHPEYDFIYDKVENIYITKSTSKGQAKMKQDAEEESHIEENFIPIYVQNGQTKTEGLEDLLKEYPEGLTKKEIRDTMGLESDQHVYTIVNYARNKAGLKIVLIGDRYKLKSSKNFGIDKTKHNTPSDGRKKNDGFQLPLETANRLQRMNPIDARDAIDMLKKSYFYKQSAEALMNASEAAVTLTTSLLS